ncbi:MAG: four helix bundle protein [Opitutaceae bacterium]
MNLVDQIHEATKGFPKEEIHGLTSRLRRAAVSAPSNLAEGQGRNSTRQFLNHSQGKVLIAQTSAVGRMSNGLSAALSRKLAGP